MESRSARVVVTGIGIVSPIGVGREPFWRALCSGNSGVARTDRFPVSESEPQLTAAVRDFDAREHISSIHLRRMDPVARMVVAAGRLALSDAHLDLGTVEREDVGIVVGSAFGDASESAGYLERVFTRGPSLASPLVFPNLVLNAAGSYLAMDLEATGVNLTVSQGEVSGERAIMLGADMLQQGRAEIVLAGGADQLARIVFDAYRRARALSAQRGGEEWSSPYDTERNGLVLGEGAAMVVLERHASARRRGARVYAEVEAQCSFGVPAGMYAWPREATAALAELRRLLPCISGNPGVDLICGSANSSRRLDACELDLFRQLVGPPERRPVHLTSIKGAIGEYGAAGAATVAAACLGLCEQTVPPLCNLRQPDGAEPFHFVRGQAEAARLERALVCGVARGGAGAALCLRRVSD